MDEVLRSSAQRAKPSPTFLHHQKRRAARRAFRIGPVSAGILILATVIAGYASLASPSSSGPPVPRADLPPEESPEGGVIVLPRSAGDREAAVVDVDILDSGYQLPGQPGTRDITIVVGDTVRWTHRGSSSHSVVNAIGSVETFDSDTSYPPPTRMQNGDTFTHQFSIAGGPYRYYCHRNGMPDGWSVRPPWTNTVAQGAGGSPSVRDSHSAVYDEAGNRMIVFGGFSGGRRNDVWVLANANGAGGSPSWTNTVAQGAGGSPSSRRYHASVYDPAHNLLIVFGGDDGSRRNDVWSLTNANGTGGSSVWFNPIPDGSPGSPTRRYGSVAAYDPATDRMILFGGIDSFPSYRNDVWVLENASGTANFPTWTLLVDQDAPGSPSGRQWAAADYDGANNRLIVFGGSESTLRNDVWVLENANGLGGAPLWSNIVGQGAAGSPTARYGHKVAYDPTNNRLVTIGGYDATYYRGDLWVLENANGLGGASKWTKTGPGLGTAGPSARVQLSAVADPANRRLIVFGGLAPSGDRNDVWVLLNASALVANPWLYPLAQGAAGSADARFAHTTVYAEATDRMVVFGGSTGTRRNDVWVLKNASGARGSPSWTLLIGQGAPGAPDSRFLHSAAYDEAKDRMIVFGGWAASGRLNDTWVLENASGLGGTPMWANLIAHGTAGSPPPRQLHSAVYDATSNRMVVFGGEDGLKKNDAWILDNANGLGGVPTWSVSIAQGAPGSPSSRSGHSAAYDPATDRMTVFGGDDGLPKNDVWVLVSATGSGGPASWSNTVAQNSPGSPPGRWWHGAGYDPDGNRLIVFGGFNGSYMNDAWVLTSANGLGGTPSWSNSLPLGAVQSPGPRYTPVVYNAVENRLVVFGGSDGAVRNDLWILADADGSPVLVGSVKAPEALWGGVLFVAVASALVVRWRKDGSRGRGSASGTS